jgi:hypothetical protein
MESHIDIYNDFHARWPVDVVRQMTLNQYVAVGDKDTFCQWLETRTRPLGSIKGLYSWKFGIWERSDKSKLPQKNYYYDEKYSWQKVFGHERDEAFNNIKSEILQIIDYSEKGRFERIDQLQLTQFVKWKIAYLYSNERLIPIFKKEILARIAEHFGLTTNYDTPYSEIQRVMVGNKPARLSSVYDYMMELCAKFGSAKEETETGKRRRPTRRAAKEKNIQTQTRQGSAAHIAEQKHNKLQERLKNKLVAEFGEQNVFMEENHVDIRVVQPGKIDFYEVKSSAYASNCIREALGQIFFYAHQEKDKRLKRLIIAGQYPPNKDEIEFMEYVKKNLNLDFSYESIDFD